MQLINVSLQTFKGKSIVKNFSLKIEKNEKIALIGEEGNGKSTLLKYIYNPKIIENYCFFSGERDIACNIGYLPQVLPNEWNQYSVEEFLLKKEIDDEYNFEMMNELYIIKKLFDDYRLSYELFLENHIMNTLSGGEKIKLQIIKIVYYHPDLILLDEPTNDLDLETIELVEKLIVKANTPIIFISHDTKLLENAANRIIHLEQIKRKTEMKFTLENMGYREYIIARNLKAKNQDNEAYRTRKEYERKKEILTKQHAQVQSDLNNAVRNPSEGRILAKKMKNILSQERKLKEMKIVEYSQSEDAINLFFHESIELPQNKMIINLENYDVKIDDKLLLTNLNISITGNEKVVFVGKNGVGKTTLIKQIYQKIKNNNSLSVGYMPQNYDDEFTKGETCVSYLLSFLGYTKDNKSKIMSYLGALNFVEEEMYSPLEDISNGQKAKIYLLKLVLMKNNVLILDEPTRNLSPLSMPVIINILSSFRGCIIASSHDRAFIEKVSTKIIYL
ncbi:MAG: ATP-binding cassette domain-containing protein [Bacilli bacterium]